MKETSVDTPDQSPSQTIEDIKKRLLTLIEEKDPKLILVKNIAKLYHDRFNQTLFKEHDLLKKALQSLDKPLEVCVDLLKKLFKGQNHFCSRKSRKIPDFFLGSRCWQ